MFLWISIHLSVHDIHSQFFVFSHSIMESDNGFDSDSTVHTDTHEAEQLLRKRTRNGVTEYLVKWYGFDRPQDNTWEPLANLECCTLLHDFEMNAQRQLQNEIALRNAMLLQRDEAYNDLPARYNALNARVSTVITYQCYLCSMNLASRGSLTRHFERIHIYDPVYCELCDYFTSSESTLRDHVTRNHAHEM